LLEGFVGSHDDGPFLIAFGDELEEEPCRLFGQREISELVNDQEIDPGQDVEHFVETTGDFGGSKALCQPFGGKEQDAFTSLCSFKAKTNGQVSLADTRSSDEENVLCRIEKFECGQFPNEFLINLGLKREVELLKPFQLRKAGSLRFGVNGAFNF